MIFFLVFYLLFLLFVLIKLNIYVKNNSNDFFGPYNKELKYGFFPFNQLYIKIYIVILILYSMVILLEKFLFSQAFLLITISYINVYYFVYFSTIYYILLLLYYYEFLMRFFSYYITYLFWYHLFLNYVLIFMFGYSIYFYSLFLFFCFLLFLNSKKYYKLNKSNNFFLDNKLIKKSNSSIDSIRFKNKL